MNNEEQLEKEQQNIIYIMIHIFLLLYYLLKVIKFHLISL